MKRSFGFATLLLVLLVASSALAQDDGLPSLADLDAGWNILEPGGETICARGTPFSFYVHPGDPDKLMVYMQGGGACWNALSCQVGGTFDDAVTDEEVSAYDGIFNFESADNPVADYSIVFIPVCTGDVHAGNAQVTYGDVTIEHRGFVNASAVLDWVYANFESPGSILLTGSSAGAFGIQFHMAYIMDHYSDTRIIQLADAGNVGLSRVQGPGILEAWGVFENMPPFIPALAELDPQDFTIPAVYEAVAAAFPENVFSQYITVADDVLLRFYGFSGGIDWTGAMYAEIDAIEAAVPNYRVFIAGGSLHTILARAEFYTYMANGVRFRDWFASLVLGEDVESVRCVECDEPEIFAGD